MHLYVHRGMRLLHNWSTMGIYVPPLYILRSARTKHHTDHRRLNSPSYLSVDFYLQRCHRFQTPWLQIHKNSLFSLTFHPLLHVSQHIRKQCTATFLCNQFFLSPNPDDAFRYPWCIASLSSLPTEIFEVLTDIWLFYRSLSYPMAIRALRPKRSGSKSLVEIILIILLVGMHSGHLRKRHSHLQSVCIGR